MSRSTPVRIEIPGAGVSGLLLCPKGAKACFVFAHGAGAGMMHDFMAAISEGLASRGISTLRYQFPFFERETGRPDSPDVCHATVRAAVAEAARRAPGIALIAGGKSFGARMTSQAQAIEPLRAVQGLAFLGFPLHPPGKPGVSRAEHLRAVHVPMLFLQGTRDRLADMDLLTPLVSRLGTNAKLVAIPGADHGFHVTKRSGGSDAQVLESLLDTFVVWVNGAAAFDGSRDNDHAFVR